MSENYFLGASLPPLQVGEEPPIDFAEFSQLLEDNLSESEKGEIAVIRRYVDINNIRSLLLEEEIDPHGNFNETELDEALSDKTGFPDYVFDFLNTYDTLTERLENFSALISSYFSNEVEGRTGFLRKYLRFEWRLRLILAALRAKGLQRDLSYELQFEDFSDLTVSGILAQKDSASYDPPIEYLDFKEKYLQNQNAPKELQRMIAEYRFERVGEFVKGNQFSLDAVMAFLVQLMIVDNWWRLDEKQGKQILETLRTSEQ